MKTLRRWVDSQVKTLVHSTCGGGWCVGQSKEQRDSQLAGLRLGSEGFSW